MVGHVRATDVAQVFLRTTALFATNRDNTLLSCQLARHTYSGVSSLASLCSPVQLDVTPLTGAGVGHE